MNMTNTPWQRYESRIQAVIDYIHTHPAGPVDNDTLAEVACLSAYHWHRIYRAITGETTAQSVRRVRMHQAASELLRSRKSIVDIGRAVGYPTIQSFTRVFKTYYGQTPAAFRNSFAQPATSAKVDPADTHAYKVTILEQPAMRLVGVWHTGDYLGVGRSFEQVMATLSIAGMPTNNSTCVGVYFQDPSSVDDDFELRSFAGIWVPDNSLVPTELVEYHLPAGRYAVLTFEGPYVLLEQAYLWLYCKWLPLAGLALRDRPAHEIYLNNPRTTAPAQLLTNICLPIGQEYWLANP